jgi:hypothetical protein
MLEADRGEVSVVCRGPGFFSLVLTPMAQHHRLHLQTYPVPRGASIFSGTNEVSAVGVYQMIAYLQNSLQVRLRARNLGLSAR